MLSEKIPTLRSQQGQTSRALRSYPRDAMLCLSVRLSVRHKSVFLSKRLDGLVCSTEASFDSLTLCCKEIQVSTKTTVLHSGTFIEFFTLMRSIILDRLSGKPFSPRVHGNFLSQQTPFPTLPFVAVGTCKNKKNTSVLSQ